MILYACFWLEVWISLTSISTAGRKSWRNWKQDEWYWLRTLMAFPIFTFCWILSHFVPIITNQLRIKEGKNVKPANLGDRFSQAASAGLQQIRFLSLSILSIICSPASNNLKFCFAPSLGTAPVVNPDQVDTQPVMVMDLPTAPSPPKVLPSNEDPAMQREKYQNGHGGSSTLEFGNLGTSSTPTPSASHVKTTTEVPSPAEGSCSDSELYDQVLQQHCVG